MVIDTHAHVVPGSLIETLRTERRLFPSVQLLAEAGSVRMAFAGERRLGRSRRGSAISTSVANG